MFACNGYVEERDGFDIDWDEVDAKTKEFEETESGKAVEEWNRRDGTRVVLEEADT